MTTVAMLADHPYAQALAWALLHFLWQGALLGLSAIVLFRLFSRSANARYSVGIITLALMLAAPITTTIWIASRQTVAPAEVAVEVVPPAAPAPSTMPLSPGESAVRPAATAQPFAGVVLVVWAAGVIALSIRLLGGWLTARRVARRALLPVTPDIHAMAMRLAERLSLRRAVNVVESAGVAVPIMVGWLKPVIVLPTSVISGFTPDQVEALIVHELAHIRRNDYLVNLLQAAVETILFYHPAVWWVSRRIRTEREHCCDDVAITICDRLVYARALSDLAALTQPTLAMAASSGSLVDRVRRILGRSHGESETGAAWLPVFLILAIVAPVLPATLQSADKAVVPVTAQTPTPPRPPAEPAPVTSPSTVAQTAPAAPATTEAPPAAAAEARASAQEKQNAEAAAELKRVQEALQKLEELQRQTTNRQYELAIAANENQSRAEIEELRVKLKALQSDLERAKRMVEVGMASDGATKELQQQIEQAQREMQSVEMKRQYESSRLMLEQKQTEEKRQYDVLLQQAARLKGFAEERLVEAELSPELVTDPNATAAAGDTVEIKVSGESELPAMRVESDGTIRPPFLGAIQVKGLTTRQISEAIAKRLTERKLATNPTVSVTLRRR